MMKNPPWDQRIARVLIRPLVRAPVTPNQLTVVTLVVALIGAGLLGTGDAQLVGWGAVIFALARFLDHFDGELARQKNMKSRIGYYLDYVTGAISYAALFLGMGLGFQGGALGSWSIVLGIGGAACAIVSMFINLRIDKVAELEDGQAIGYPGVAGFELEDGIYLLVPIAWFGWLEPFFALAGIGATVYCLWTLAMLVRLRRSSA